MSMFPSDLPGLGDLVLDQYRVDGLLGSGNVGVVYSAYQEALARHVALKFVRGAYSGGEFSLRLVREARAAGRISDPHVITVFDSGFLTHLPGQARWVRSDSGLPFIVMEYLRGVDLNSLLEDTERPLEVTAVLGYMSEACKGLAAIHRQGTVHRDIKPANLFLSETDSQEKVIKITDFGVSRFLATEDTDAAPLTRPNELLGSLPYMSPEQVRSSSSVGVPADLWSLGVTGYELLTQRLPFEAEDQVGIIERILHSEPTPLSLFRLGVPAPVVALLDRCLSKDPSRRFVDAAALGTAIEEVLARINPEGRSEAPLPPELSGRYWLHVIKGERSGYSAQVGSLFRVGRSEGIELSLRDGRASRLHAQVRRVGPTTCIVEDLGSMNGTFVNGERIKSAELKTGDEITIGGVVLRFEVLEEPEHRPRWGTLRYGGPDET